MDERDHLRVLLKAKAELPVGTPFNFAGASLQLDRLFTSVGRGEGLALQGGSDWYVLKSPDQDPDRAWDFCHQLLSQGLGVAGAGPAEFAEPDFHQHWPTGDINKQALTALKPCSQPEAQNPDYPQGIEPLWYKGPTHSDFDSPPAGLGQIRIAHLDTGYDPKHQTLPKRLATKLARNFVDADRPNDATDTSSGLINNLGHGTGTLSILAGEAVEGRPAVGAATGATIVPVRVANSVVLFYNSAIARAFDYVHSLTRNPATHVHVVTMSMGGLASQAWADAVNALYDAGVVIITAAGNNYGNFPTRHIVYPARFNRVVAACGVMADGRPYADLNGRLMAGNYGPAEKMRTAVAACTPNLPWARIGCPSTIDQDGNGTSSATPQVAAAAALWIRKNKAQYDAYSPAWKKAEAVRRALFDNARNTNSTYFGRGELDAKKTLSSKPATDLKAEAPDTAAFPIFRVLTGLGVAPDARMRMLELEALQLSQSAQFESLDAASKPPEQLTAPEKVSLAQNLADHPRASSALREALRPYARSTSRSQILKIPEKSSAVEKLHLERALSPPVPPSARRRLRVYAYDPSLEAKLETLHINRTVVDVPWEDDLQPGPCGEYIEVVDVDPASRCCYAPVDLSNPHVIAQDGLAPSESNPQFHQQMAYAVAMKTIEHFERALGRVALWAPRKRSAGSEVKYDYVPRLRIYPHAIRAANAFYSPDRKALMLGYFIAGSDARSDVLPGGTVFSATSHDIIAHETTHALLDGLHRRFQEPTNPDVLAFHEAFADIVALMQHFTLPEALLSEIGKTRGNLTDSENLLGKLAVQFGHATGRYGALRDAIGAADDHGVWRRRKPSRTDYASATEPHDRGAILVSAVFDAFLELYQARAAGLIKLATSGTGVLPDGDLPTELADRLAREASKVAGQVLNICIRALDYCPPVDITFGEYLRALITADRDLVPDDVRTYRVAFMSAFRDRGIYPSDVKNLSVDSLAWEPPPLPLDNIKHVIAKLNFGWDLEIKRSEAFELSLRNAETFRAWLLNAIEVPDDQLSALGLYRTPGPFQIGKTIGELRGIEVHSVRPAKRVGPDGIMRSDLVVEITQSFHSGEPGDLPFRGGCTLLIDLDEAQVKYFVRKRVDSEARFNLQQGNDTNALAVADTYGMLRGRSEPFAMLHRSA